MLATGALIPEDGRSLASVFLETEKKSSLEGKKKSPVDPVFFVKPVGCFFNILPWYFFFCHQKQVFNKFIPSNLRKIDRPHMLKTYYTNS